MTEILSRAHGKFTYNLKGEAKEQIFEPVGNTGMGRALIDNEEVAEVFLKCGEKSGQFWKAQYELDTGKEDKKADTPKKSEVVEKTKEPEKAKEPEKTGDTTGDEAPKGDDKTGDNEQAANQYAEAFQAFPDKVKDCLAMLEPFLDDDKVTKADVEAVLAIEKAKDKPRKGVVDRLEAAIVAKG